MYVGRYFVRTHTTVSILDITDNMHGSITLFSLENLGFEDKIGMTGTEIIKKGKRETVECLTELAASNRYGRRLMLLKRKRMDVERNEAPSRGLRLLHSAGRTGVIEARAEKPHRSSLHLSFFCFVCSASTLRQGPRD